MAVRHLSVAPDGTLYVVDGHGRVFADLAPEAARLAVALAPSTLFRITHGRRADIVVSRAATIRIEAGGRILARASFPAALRPLGAPAEHPSGLATLRVRATAGAAVATHELRVVGRGGLTRADGAAPAAARAAARVALRAPHRGCAGAAPPRTPCAAGRPVPR